MNRTLVTISMRTAAGMRLRPLSKVGFCGARFVSSQYKKKHYVDPDPQIGDYPNLPQVFSESRSERGWWDRQNRRNFGETIPEQYEILNMLGPTQYKSPGWKQVSKMWAGFIITIGSVYYFISQTAPERPYMRAYYPNGLKEELGGLPTRTMADAIKEASESS
ncbi:hypothetical protein H4R24_001882 [Coemansia sp. RSA 988]|nr:hypothetical protein H4R24_001882 [Coemansia sp. RSA 988]